MCSRTPALESQFVQGPVVILIGGRISAERPSPRPYRRVADGAKDEHFLLAIS
jgi:hypothetical protein